MKKISVNTIKSFLKERQDESSVTVTFPVGESSFEVEIRTSLSITRQTAFINRVLSGCFDAEGNYLPEYVTPMLRATILQMCTNVPVISLKKGEDDEGGSLMDLQAMNDLYEAMDLDHLEDPNYQNMMCDIACLSREAIEWKRRRTLDAGSTDNALRGLISAATEKVNELNVEELMRFAGQLVKTIEGLSENGFDESRIKAVMDTSEITE